MAKLLLQFSNPPSGVGAEQLFDNQAHLDEILQAWVDSSKLADPVISNGKLSYKINEQEFTATITEKPDDFTN